MSTRTTIGTDWPRGTDAYKLISWLDFLGVPVNERGEKSFEAARRRFYFNRAGELEKILDYGPPEA